MAEFLDSNDRQLHWTIGYATTNGHIIHTLDDGRRMLCSTGEIITDEAALPCSVCGKVRPEAGYDPCLGLLDGVMAACCGHGELFHVYVKLEDKTRLGGEDAISFFAGRGVKLPEMIDKLECPYYVPRLGLRSSTQDGKILWKVPCTDSFLKLMLEHPGLNHTIWMRSNARNPWGHCDGGSQ